MLLKITDGIVTHYLDGADEVRVTRIDGYSRGDDEFADADGVEALHLYLDHEPSEDEPTHRDVVVLQPSMGPKSIVPRTIVTDYAVYLLNDQGKTVEVINRAN